MKNFKLLCTLAICFMAFHSAEAQISLGVKAGINMSSTYGTPEKLNDEAIESIGLRPGFQAGLVLGLGLTDNLKIVGEVNFENRNGLKKIDLTSIVPTPLGEVVVVTDADVENSFNYINVPILFAFGGESLKFYVGPNFAYLISAKSKVTTTTGVTLPEGLPVGTPGIPVGGTIESENDFINDAPYEEDGSFINQLDIGANLGIMYQLTEKLNLDLRVNHGLTDATNNDYDSSLLTGTAREDSDRNISIQLSLGVAF